MVESRHFIYHYFKIKKNLKGFGRENASDNDGGAGDAPSHVLQRAMVKRVRTVQASVWTLRTYQRFVPQSCVPLCCLVGLYLGGEVAAQLPRSVGSHAAEVPPNPLQEGHLCAPLMAPTIRPRPPGECCSLGKLFWFLRFFRVLWKSSLQVAVRFDAGG